MDLMLKCIESHIMLTKHLAELPDAHLATKESVKTLGESFASRFPIGETADGNDLFLSVAIVPDPRSQTNPDAPHVVETALMVPEEEGKQVEMEVVYDSAAGYADVKRFGVEGRAVHHPETVLEVAAELLRLQAIFGEGGSITAPAAAAVGGESVVGNASEGCESLAKRMPLEKQAEALEREALAHINAPAPDCPRAAAGVGDNTRLLGNCDRNN